MKKSFIFCFLSLTHLFFGQIRLSDVSLELKKNSDFHQLITQDNQNTKEIFSFVADKEKFVGIKFNSAIFFSDSISLKRPFNFRFLMGCGFTLDNKPIAYWATEDLQRFIGIEFDYETHTTKTVLYPLDLSKQTLFTQFYINHTLYFLTEEKETKSIQLIGLKGHEITSNILDFSEFQITNSKNNNTNLSALLHEYGLTKMEDQLFNSYLNATPPIKYYLRKNTLILTLDQNLSKTQIFEIDLSHFQIQEIIFNKSDLPNSSASNSLLYQNRLVQLMLNSEKLEIEFFDYSTKEKIKQYTIATETSSPFPSDFLIQTGNNSPTTLKNSKKFIKKLQNSDLGASLYCSNGNYIATFGGYTEHIRSSAMLLDIGLQMAGAGGGDLLGSYVNQNIFFDVQLDPNFNSVDTSFEPLYIDKIAQFTAQNNVNYETIFPYKDFFIMSYYDSKKEEIVLTKFTNGYDY